MAARLPTLGLSASDAAEPTGPADWRWQVRHAITDLAGLEAHLRLTEAEREGVRRALRDGFPMSITPHYLSLCDADDPSCPVRRQCVPVVEEAVAVPGDLRDPLGEEAHEVAPHLVQRYPDRALLLATDRCSVYCRFCTRSRMVGAGGGARSMERLAPAFAWLRAHPEVRDVIVSGGDPLVMRTERIAEILAALAEIESLDTVRVATRTPVTLPQRIDGELCAALRGHPAVWLMTHFNHPKELAPEARMACARLVDAGIPVMNQTVLLRGVNDDAEVLEQLFRTLVRTRVRPYYLLQADPVRGTGHLRTPLATGLAIMERLQGRLTGIAVPKFIVDTPGGRGKVPLLPDYVAARAVGTTTLRTFRGELVDYVDPPTPCPPTLNDENSQIPAAEGPFHEVRA
jgi:lysine 2,3-aminomutase